MARRDSKVRPFFCREWVFEKIQTCLDKRHKGEDGKTKGVIVVGGPGSGKTTLLSEIVGPRTKEGLQVELSRKVVAHHFCEANNTDSLSVSEFIRSFGEQLSRCESLGPFGYQDKLRDPKIQKYLTPVECARNPDVALKEGILLPLNSLKAPEEIFLVIVDSVDESCLHNFDADTGVGVSHSIAELLATHVDLLPPWLFVVLSARKQSKTVVKMFTGFRKFTLDDLRKSHVVRDIQQYILNRLDAEPDLRVHLTRETAEVFNQLHIKSSGCFLYLEKVLDGVIDEFFSLEEVPDIPGTLNGLYLWLCNRVYTEGQFEKLRPVLDVMLATQTPLKEVELYEAVWTRDNSLTTEAFWDIVAMMGHILIDINGSKSIFHHSFAEWLIDVKHCTGKYLCNPADGHAMLALRATHLATQGNLQDSIDFAFHLSRANPKAALTDQHLALWLLWSNAPISDALLSVDLPRQEALQLLINAGADVNWCDSEGRSALSCAQESEESIKALLEKGASVDELDRHGRSLLSNASFSGNTDIVRLLLKHGASVNQVDQCGQSALMLAARQGRSEIVYLLANCGAFVNHSADDGCTALRAAASCGHSDVVSVLLDHGADVNQADDDQRTALRGAAWGGHSDIVLHLLQHGANPNSADKDGRTALIAASYMGHKKVVEILLDDKADVNHADNDGRTALSVGVLCSASGEYHEEVVELLLERGANVDIPDYDGMTPLCVACLEGHLNVVQLLLDAGADAGHWDRNGRTPLFAAASGGHTHIVDMLLSRKDGKIRQQFL